MSRIHVALFSAVLLACGTRVSLGELVPDERSSEDGTTPPPFAPKPDAPTSADAGEPLEAGPSTLDSGDVDGGKAPYAACAGKQCGDDCSVCDPLDPFCVETAVLKACDENGACVAAPATCN